MARCEVYFRAFVFNAIFFFLRRREREVARRLRSTSIHHKKPRDPRPALVWGDRTPQRSDPARAIRVRVGGGGTAVVRDGRRSVSFRVARRRRESFAKESFAKETPSRRLFCERLRLALATRRAHSPRLRASAIEAKSVLKSHILSAPGPYPPSGFRDPEIPRDPEISPPRVPALAHRAHGARRRGARRISPCPGSPPGGASRPRAPALGPGRVSACVCWYFRMVQSKT